MVRASLLYTADSHFLWIYAGLCVCMCVYVCVCMSIEQTFSCSYSSYVSSFLSLLLYNNNAVLCWCPYICSNLTRAFLPHPPACTQPASPACCCQRGADVASGMVAAHTSASPTWTPMLATVPTASYSYQTTGRQTGRQGTSYICCVILKIY